MEQVTWFRNGVVSCDCDDVYECNGFLGLASWQRKIGTRHLNVAESVAGVHSHGRVRSA